MSCFIFDRDVHNDYCDASISAAIGDEIFLGSAAKVHQKDEFDEYLWLKGYFYPKAATL